MRGWLSELAALAVPGRCAGCGRGRTVLCDECHARLCRGPGAVLRARPVPEPPGLPPVYAAVPYQGVPRAVLLAHKERGALPLARPLGVALAHAVRAVLRRMRAEPAETVPAPVAGTGTAPGGKAGGDGGARPPAMGRKPGGAGERVLLVPVPSDRRSVLARGHDPMRRIALAAAGELRSGGMPVRVACLLRRRRRVADQAGLSAAERLVNMAGALEAAAVGTEGERVVLVDDLVTTGASLAEAARAVTAVGGRVAGAAVVATTCGPGRRTERP